MVHMAAGKRMKRRGEDKPVSKQKSFSVGMERTEKAVSYPGTSTEGGANTGGGKRKKPPDEKVLR